MSNDVMLTLALLGIGIYFSVLMVRGLLGLLRFRRVQPTALVTWPVRRPAHFPFMLALGIVSALLAFVLGYLQKPFHHVYSQAVMALYFMLLVPLSARIRLGLYRDGVWADTGFLPYRKIGRLAFREGEEIVLILLPRGGSGSFRLPVPPAEYGTVRKLLEEKIRAQVVQMEAGILGL
jgi:hypothetical protein